MQPAHPDPLDPLPQPDAKRLTNPRRLLLVLVGAIFSIELLLMSVLHLLEIPSLIEIVIDSLALVLLLMPLLLKTVVYPMQSKIEALDQAQRSLRTATTELEQRVQERTLALSAANASLKQEIETRAMMQEELKRQAATDILTGLRNRRAFKEFAEMELKRAGRYGTPLSLVMFDLDHFKQINDTFGHHAGDEVLVHVALLIGERIRASEILARWGGEEFILLLPQTRLEEAVHLSNELRERLHTHAFPAVGTVTASFGVTQFEKGNSLDSMLHRADIALYRAKDNGRNQVECEPPMTS